MSAAAPGVPGTGRAWPAARAQQGPFTGEQELNTNTAGAYLCAASKYPGQGFRSFKGCLMVMGTIVLQMVFIFPK